MIKYVVIGVVILIIYRMWGSSTKQLQDPGKNGTSSIDDSDWVDYEEIE